MFFSDAVRELDPAREAGCQTRLVMREGNAPVEDRTAIAGSRASMFCSNFLAVSLPAISPER